MRAIIFDLNGTMINDMDYHTRAWREILNTDLGGSFSVEEVKENMYGKNNEVLVRMFGKGRFSPEEMDRLSLEKEHRYQKAYLPELRLLPGLHDFLEQAYKMGIPMAIGSAAIPFNINFVLDGLDLQHYFKAKVSANDVKVSKPHPETFLKAAQLMGINPKDCLVFEDVPKGAEAAANAGMKTVILTTTHQPEEFSANDNVLHFASDFNDQYIKRLLTSDYLETTGKVLD